MHLNNLRPTVQWANLVIGRDDEPSPVAVIDVSCHRVTVCLVYLSSERLVYA